VNDHLPGQGVAEFFSLWMTWPSVGLSLLVVYLWGPQAWRALFKGSYSPTELFVLGVAAGFIGEVCDSLFWGFAWSLSYIEHPWKHGVFQSGVFFNIVFRQLMTMVAAYFHVQSYIRHREVSGDVPETSWPVRMLLRHTAWCSVLLGLVYSLLLASMR